MSKEADLEAVLVAATATIAEKRASIDADVAEAKATIADAIAAISACYPAFYDYDDEWSKV